jgi:ATP-dependent Clp protease ATP-binding subunit ClpA
VSTEAAQRLPFSRRGREALEQALREAVARGDDHLGEEHLLLALLRDPGSRAVSCLTRLRVTPPMVVDAIAAVLAGEAALSGGRRPSRRAAATPRPAR